MKSDERSISAIAAQAHNAEADKRSLQKKLAASERRVHDLEERLVSVQAESDEKVRNLTDKLSEEMAKVSSMMQQLVDFMMGKGAVSLSDTLRDTVVAGVRDEVRKEFQGILEEKDARIAALEALVNQDHDGESPETTIKKLEHQNEDLCRTTYGQKTEGKYNGRNKGQKVPQRPQPLKLTAREIVIEPDYVPDGAVLCKGQEDKTYRIVRHSAWIEMVCFVRPNFARLASLTQSAKSCKCNVQKYFHDILNRVMVTAKEELTCILPHKWVEPVMIPLVY